MYMCIFDNISLCLSVYVCVCVRACVCLCVLSIHNNKNECVCVCVLLIHNKKHTPYFRFLLCFVSSRYACHVVFSNFQVRELIHLASKSSKHIRNSKIYVIFNRIYVFSYYIEPSYFCF